MASQMSPQRRESPNAFEARDDPVDVPALKIVLADGSRRVSNALGRRLNELQIEPQSVVNDGLMAIEQVRLHLPDVALLGLEMPRCDGIDATRIIRAAWPVTRVIVTARPSELDVAARVGQLGASLVVPHDLPAAALTSALIRALLSSPPASGGSRGASSAALTDRAAGPDTLSRLERDMLLMIAAGASQREAAAALGISKDALEAKIREVVVKWRRRSSTPPSAMRDLN